MKERTVTIFWSWVKFCLVKWKIQLRDQINLGSLVSALFLRWRKFRHHCTQHQFTFRAQAGDDWTKLLSESFSVSLLKGTQRSSLVSKKGDFLGWRNPLEFASLRAMNVQAWLDPLVNLILSVCPPCKQAASEQAKHRLSKGWICCPEMDLMWWEGYMLLTRKIIVGGNVFYMTLR